MSSLLSERVFRSCIACLGSAGLSACSVGPDFQLPETGLPEHYLARVNTSKTVPASELVASVNLTQWWRSFLDPHLFSLVDRSISPTPDIPIPLPHPQHPPPQQ